jgi:hypothetical protein
MATRRKFFLAAFFLFALGTGQCFASTLSAEAAGGELSQAQVLSQLQRDGYSTVWHLQREGDVFVGEALNLAGNPVEVQVDPSTGQVVLSQGFRFLNL